MNERIPLQLYVLLAMLSVVWGCNWPILKIVLGEMAPMHFRSWCLGGGAVGLSLLALATRQSLAVPKGAWPALIAASLLNVGAGNICVAFGVPLLESGRAAILSFTFPVWGVIAGALIANEPLTRRRVVGVALGLAAVLVLIGDDLAALGRSPIGSSLMLGAAVGWAIGTAVMKRWPVRMPVLSYTAWQIGIPAIPIILIAAVNEQGSFNPFSLSLWPMLGVAYNVFICFVFCYWAWMKVATSLPVAVSSLGTLFVPVIGLISGALVLGERPHLSDYVALVLVVASMAVVLIPADVFSRRAKRAGAE